MRRAFLLLITVAALATAAAPPTRAADAAPPPAGGAPSARVDIKVTNAGFEPREVRVKRGRPTTLAFTRLTDRTCIKAIDIPDEKVKDLALPLHQTVTVTVTPAKVGVVAFHCSAMAMGNGKLIVED